MFKQNTLNQMKILTFIFILDHCPNDVIWGYLQTQHNGDRVITSNIEECMELCRSEQSFLCLSVDYEDNGQCYLSRENIWSVDGIYNRWSLTGKHGTDVWFII